MQRFLRVNSAPPVLCCIFFQPVPLPENNPITWFCRLDCLWLSRLSLDALHRNIFAGNIITSLAGMAIFLIKLVVGIAKKKNNQAERSI